MLEKFYKLCVKFFVLFFYKAEYIGFDKLPKTGPVLLIANHVSYVDGVFIQVGYSKRNVRFLIDQYIYEKPLINYFMKIIHAIPILPKKDNVEKALQNVSIGLEEGHVIAIFPEGQLTYTGNLGRFKPGIEWIIENDPVPIYPIAISGLWDSVFSRKYHKSKFSWLPRGFRSRVVLKCGDVIHPKHVKVNMLQKKILELKKTIQL